MTVALTHLTDADIERFHRRRLTAETLLAFSDHLAACRECQDRVAAGADKRAALAALEAGLGIAADDHVPEHEIQAFVDGGLEPARRGAILAHLQQCSACAEEVRDLKHAADIYRGSASFRPSWMFGALAAAAVLVVALGASLFWRAHGGSPGPLAEVEGTNTLDAADARRVRDALDSGRLSLPSTLSALTGRQETLLGLADAAAFRLSAPVSTAVLETQPTLRWTALPQASSYIVTIQEQSTGETISSAPLQRTEWAPTRALERGRTYAWQVAASIGGREVVAPRPPAPPARFLVVDISTARRFERPPPSALIRGILYADAGLLDDAEQAFKTIRSSGPGADRVDVFLAQLRDARR